MLLRIAMMLTLMLASSNALAGKIEDVQEAIKKECGKEVSKDDAIKIVKDLFLTCSPGQNVDAAGCKVKCLKTSPGSVVGG